MDVPAPRKSFGRAFESPHSDYMEDRPTNDVAVVDTIRTTRVSDNRRLSEAKVGTKIKMKNGNEGTIVARDGHIVKVFDEGSQIVREMPISETYFKDEVLSDVTQMMWNRMDYDQRMYALSKSKIPSQYYVNRDWFDIPENIKTVLKDQANMWSEPSTGHSPREPGITRDAESESFHDKTNPPHVGKPYEDKPADALDETKQKSDVESGMYGGISTRQEPLDATEDYEEDERDGKKELTTPQRDINSEFNKPDPSKDRDKIEFENKGTKCEVCGGAHTTDNHEVEKEGGLTSNSVGVANPVHGDDKPQSKQKSFIFENNTRFGARYGVTKADFEKTKKTPV